MTNAIRKAWHDYPDEYRAALIKAHLSGYTARFRFAHEAKSWQVRMQYMGARIRRDQDAPKALRDAAAAVVWGLPALGDLPDPNGTAWTITGASSTRMTDAELVAQMRDAGSADG